jgi:hypothetical protein
MGAWPQELPMWVVYDHPSDFPNNYVARRWHGERATSDLMVCPDLEVIRRQLRLRGLYKLDRWEGDDPMIVEVWL